MSLAGVGPGDIVRVGGCLAYVRDREKGRLKVRWHKTTNERWITAREVEAHWRRRK